MRIHKDAACADITYRIFGAALDVHHRLGRGLKESVYQGMRTDALSLRFRRVEQAAAKSLEPKMQVVRLGSATLKSAQDVRDWVARTEKTLLERLVEGPIILE